MNKLLIPVRSEHASELFPLIYKTSVVKTIQWDGPATLEEYVAGLVEREQATRAGSMHMFTIVEPETGKLAGSIDLRPDADSVRARARRKTAERIRAQRLPNKYNRIGLPRSA